MPEPMNDTPVIQDEVQVTIIVPSNRYRIRVLVNAYTVTLHPLLGS
jgi:hypothetical protein